MTPQGAASAESGVDRGDAGEKRPAKLAMSRQFLAAPTGNTAGCELSSEEVRLANYLDSWKVPDADGSMDPNVRKMVRSGTGVPTAPLGQRPAWAFERGDDLSSPEPDDVCQRIPAPWELENERASEEQAPSQKFANYKETVLLRQSKSVSKRGLVSPGCDKEEASVGDDSARRVRFQPRMRNGNTASRPDGAPTLQAGAASVFTVAKEPSDECGMFRYDAGTAGGTPGGFAVRQDTEVLNKRGDFEAREDTEVLRMGTGGGFDVREDTEVLRIGDSDMHASSGLNNAGGFEIREDTEVLRPTATLQSGAFNVREDTAVLGNNGTTDLNQTGVFSIREDTEVLGNTHTTGTAAFGIREDTEVLNRTNNTATGDAFAIREDTEVLGKQDNPTGVFSIREDTQVLDDSVFSRCAPPMNTTGAADDGMFSVREDTEVLGGDFSVREDTEVLANLGTGKKGDPSAQSGWLNDQQRCGSSGALLGGERFDSVRVLGPAVALGSNDLASLRAPSGHLRPIKKSGSLPLAEAGGLDAAGSSQKTLRESKARRKLQFGDVAPSSVAGAGESAVGGEDLASSLLMGASVELPEAEDFTVLEAEDAQGSGSVENSQSRELFLDDEDTENAAVVASSGAARLQAALAAANSGAGGSVGGAAARGARSTAREGEMLRTLDDCPEHVLKWGSEVDADSRPASVHTSPVHQRGGSASLPGSPLQSRAAVGSGCKPPLSPAKHLQGHARRGVQAAGRNRSQAELGRQFGDSTLQSSAKTINPFLPEFTSSNISKISPLTKFSGVHEIPHSKLRTYVDALAAGHAATLPDASLEPGTTPLGSGGYATVYSATLSSSCIAGTAGERVALKVATPAAAWEFAAARVITERVPARYAALFLPARCIFLSSGWDAPSYDAGSSRGAAPKVRCALGALPAGEARGSKANMQQSLSVLAMPQGVDGTLLDLVNAHKAAAQPIGDALMLYIALQMLLILHAMQQARVIHTDLKPDNCLLSWPPAVSSNARPVAGRTPAWSAQSASARGSQWGAGCLQAIDFGRAIDLQLLPVGTQFDGVSTTEGMQCPEMLSGKPWHYCHDAFCVAGTIHAVLLGKYIAVQQAQSLASSGGVSTGASHKPLYRPSTSVPSTNPRKPLWDRLFHTLLNCPLAPERPDVTPLLAEFTSALETAEASKPRLWHDMATARQLTAGFLSRHRAE